MTNSELSRTIEETLGRFADQLEQEEITVDREFIEELSRTIYCQALGQGLEQEAASRLARSVLELESWAAPGPTPVSPAVLCLTGQVRALQA